MRLALNLLDLIETILRIVIKLVLIFVAAFVAFYCRYNLTNKTQTDWVSVIMPTVARFGALRIVVYPNDHRPAHVHVIGEGCEAVFNLNCPHGPPELRENFGFSNTRVNRIKTALVKELGRLCAEWNRIHEGQ